MNKLTLAEVKEIRAALPVLIDQYQMARTAKFAHPMNLDAGKIMGDRMRSIKKIGDKLTVNIVTACDSIDALVDKVADHGYIPTLLGKPGSPESMLADIYDLVSGSRGYAARAFRGTV